MAPSGEVGAHFDSGALNYVARAPRGRATSQAELRAEWALKSHQFSANMIPIYRPIEIACVPN